MPNYPNGRPGGHILRPAQLQFSGIAHSQLRSSDAHDGSNVEMQDPLLNPQLYGTDEQSSVADSYVNGDYGSQSNTSYRAEESPSTPRIDDTQGYRQWPSPSGPQNYPVGLAQEYDVLQTGEHSDSIRSAFQQQGNHMEAASALGLGDNRHHIVPRRSSTTLSPEIGVNRVGHARRNLQHESSGTDGRSSVGSRTFLQASNLDMTQTLGPRPSAAQVSTSHWQVDPTEAVTTAGWNLSLLSFDWPVGNERNDLADINNSNVGGPWHNSQTTYRGFPQQSRASPFQFQGQGFQSGTGSSLPFAQDPSMMSYGMQSLDSHHFARSPHEPPPGNTKTHLSPTWQPTNKVPSNLHYGERPNVSDNEVRQGPRRTTRGSKRKCPSDPPSPTTPPTRTKRKKRKYTPEEKAVISQKRKTGVCKDCKIAKRRVCGSLQTSLYRYQQAYCSCSASIRPLGMALP